MVIEVTAAIIERDGKVLAARRTPGDPLAGLWEFPGGKLEPGESQRECLRRELREELAIECEIGDHIVSSPYDYRDKRIILHAYAARIVRGEPQRIDHDRLCWQVPEALMSLDWAPADIAIVKRYQSLWPQRRSLQYYDVNAAAYAQETRQFSMGPHYQRFLSYLPADARILDLGCGSGRDSLYFSSCGYRVTAVDASAAMVAEAARLTGLPVSVMKAQQLCSQQAYEGVWCSASLLHCPQADLAELFHRIAEALVPGGICFASFKSGQGERIDSKGRFFCDQTPHSLGLLLQGEGLLQSIDLWEGESLLRGQSQRWSCMLARRRQ